MTYANFSYVSENTVLQGTVISTLTKKTQEECEKACVDEYFCKSINIENAGNRKCELNSENVLEKWTNLTLTRMIGWSYKATDYNNTLVGETCRILKPCPVNHIYVCTDTCTCPGYKCHLCKGAKIGIDCLKVFPIRERALGLEDRSILDHQMSGTQFSPHQAYKGRLNFWGGWCTNTLNKHQYLQVDFLSNKIISSIAVQGYLTKSVTKYTLWYTEDTNVWQVYEEDGDIKIFDGPATEGTTKKQDLFYYIRAISVKLNPQNWVNGICMRMELYGIEITDMPLGIEHKTVRDYQLSASGLGGRNGRLNAGGWCADETKVHSGIPQFFRVDFVTRKIITEVAIQGHSTLNYHLSTYQLSYTYDSYEWEDYKLNGNTHTFSVPTLALNQIKKEKLPTHIRAFAVKILPKTWRTGDNLCMRMELYGFEDPSQPILPQGCYTNSKPLGIASGLIPDYKIIASSFYQGLDPYRGRLNAISRSWSTANNHNPNDYVQVNVGKKMLIDAIATQGRPHYSQWVKTFHVSYSIVAGSFTWVWNGSVKRYLLETMTVMK
eukprot:gene6700-7462_t